MNEDRKRDAEPVAGLPERRPGPEALKAFAHPLRMAMYSRLTEQGPATATMLARALGESTGQTSYHLRQLERHGFIEDDPGHAGGRERWWRTVGFTVEDPQDFADPGGRAALLAVAEGIAADRVRSLLQWVASAEQDGPWDGALVSQNATVQLTPEALAELVEELQVVLQRHLDLAKQREAAGETGGTRRVRVTIEAVPLLTAEELAER